MKRFSFISAVLAIILTVTFVSCTTTREYSDEYYDRGYDRVYLDAPYYGYDVTPYGYYYSTPYNGRYYNRRNNDHDRDGRYKRDNDRKNNWNTNNYNRNSNSGHQSNQNPTVDQRRDWQNNRSEARRQILGH